MTLWFLARAAGLMTLLGATTAVCFGAWTSGWRTLGRAQSREPRLLQQPAHRSVAVVTVALLALHIALLVLDSHISLSLPGALVPFTAGYRGVALGLGTLAAYCFAVVTLTGVLRGRLGGSARAARWWRPVHALAYLAWPLALAHGVLAGTDTRSTWALLLYAGSTLAVVVTVWARLSAEERVAAGPLSVTRRRAQSRVPTLDRR